MEMRGRRHHDYCTKEVMERVNRVAIVIRCESYWYSCAVVDNALSRHLMLFLVQFSDTLHLYPAKITSYNLSRSMFVFLYPLILILLVLHAYSCS